MAIALERAGIEDVLVVDRADDLGGTWRDNTYPGAACDVPSSLYSFSFRPAQAAWFAETVTGALAASAARRVFAWSSDQRCRVRDQQPCSAPLSRRFDLSGSPFS